MDPASLSPGKRKQIFDNRIWDEALTERETPIDSGFKPGAEGPHCGG
jgi:hypothetical protein